VTLESAVVRGVSSGFEKRMHEVIELGNLMVDHVHVLEKGHDL
jgi:hypothetical protein